MSSLPLLTRVKEDGVTFALTRRGSSPAIARTGPTRVGLGGHSYGGRQASMLAADEPGLARSLLLLAYPLHPPNRPAELRVAHFPRLHTPALFVHGTTDPFGSVAELRRALTGSWPAAPAFASELSP